MPPILESLHWYHWVILALVVAFLVLCYMLWARRRRTWVYITDEETAMLGLPTKPNQPSVTTNCEGGEKHTLFLVNGNELATLKRYAGHTGKPLRINGQDTGVDCYPKLAPPPKVYVQARKRRGVYIKPYNRRLLAQADKVKSRVKAVYDKHPAVKTSLIQYFADTYDMSVDPDRLDDADVSVDDLYYVVLGKTTQSSLTFNVMNNVLAEVENHLTANGQVYYRHRDAELYD